VVLCDPEGEPAAMITDRDLTIRALAEDRSRSEPARKHASRPLVTGEPDMDLEEAAALMVQHGIRRLPIVDGDDLTGIVTLDDIAVRTGNLEVAQRMTQEVIEGALPGFFFHERG
jgi:CBS domain-containing protein